MKKIYFAIHSHQPVGNFEHVFEEAFQKSYKPFVESLKGRNISLSLHISGPLFDFIESHHPDFIDLIGRMVEQGRIEMLSGGYYEPILATIPFEDAIGQLDMMNGYLKKRFGVSPKGFWLTERIWDDAVIDIASAAGLSYTMVDDSHIFYAGKSEADRYHPWIAERHGKKLTIFPVDKTLRYSIPFHEPADIDRYIRESIENHGTSSFFYGDDGEKFGVWPGTYKWVFEEGWLGRFLDWVESSDIVKLAPISDAFESLPPKGRIYLPPASYEEMMEWALPTNLQERFTDLKKELRDKGDWERFSLFMKGGIWNTFLSKYPESNRMLKRSLILSKRVRSAAEEAGRLRKKSLRRAVNKARRHLYMSQCNCGYWHGLFGGVYLNYLRDAVYRNIIDGENYLDREQSSFRAEKSDYLADGSLQTLFQNGDMSIGFDGCGRIFWMENRRKAFSLSNVFSRRREVFHRDLGKKVVKGETVSIHDISGAKEEGLEGLVIYDQYEKLFLLEHFSESPFTLDAFKNSNIEEIDDLWSRPIHLKTPQARRRDDFENYIQLRGTLRSKIGIKYTKKVTLYRMEPYFEIEYTFKNETMGDVNFYFGVENNLTLLTNRDPLRYMTSEHKKLDLIEPGEYENVCEYTIHNNWDRFKMVTSYSDFGKMFVFPVETISNSEGGIERTYQGTSVLNAFEIRLEPEKSVKIVRKLILNNG